MTVKELKKKIKKVGKVRKKQLLEVLQG